MRVTDTGLHVTCGKWKAIANRQVRKHSHNRSDEALKDLWAAAD